MEERVCVPHVDDACPTLNVLQKLSWFISFRPWIHYKAVREKFTVVDEGRLDQSLVFSNNRVVLVIVI